ncbi:MAG: hypothetical protein ACOCWJ_04505 [Verrucomicrobiota bacterium]
MSRQSCWADTARDLAGAIAVPDQAEEIAVILRRLGLNDRGLTCERQNETWRFSQVPYDPRTR